MIEYNLVGLAENFARAYEIAKVGNFKVKIVTHGDNHASEQDIKLFNEFYGFAETEENPDMILELCYGPSEILNLITRKSRSETLEEINTRIDDIVLSDIVVDKTLNQTCTNLFKTSIDKLHLSLTDSIKVIDIAATIAKMAQSTSIKAEHIAEAIHYKSYKAE